MVPKDVEFHEKVDVCNEIVQIRLYINENVIKLNISQILQCKTVFFSPKFGILGTSSWGLKNWFPGIPRPHLTWEKIQKVPRGLLVHYAHFSLQCAGGRNF